MLSQDLNENYQTIGIEDLHKPDQPNVEKNSDYTTMAEDCLLFRCN